MTRSMGRVLRAVALLTVLGCTGDGGPGPTPTIAVSVTPGTLSLQQGTSGTVTVSLTRGGFTGPVNVSVDGLPTGVTVGVAPTPLTGATTSATVTVTVGATVAAGPYTATIRATATGVGEATATYTLTVTAIPTFALTATPPTVSISQGTTGTTTIGVVRTNFAGGVALTLDAPPAGITGSFNPTPANGDQSVLTVSVASTVATGNYNLLVKGSATGPGEKAVTVTLTVTPPPDYTLTATPNALTIVAGVTGTTTVNIARTSFTGAVTLALDAPPAGITATFNPTAPTGATSAATISVASTVVAAVYTLTIKGTATGVPTAVDSGAAAVDVIAPGDRTTTVTVTVLPVPDFAIVATPNAVTVSQGGTGNTTVNVTRTNFAGDIALSLVTPPAGITGVFTPATVTGAVTSAALVISVAGTVAAGAYPVTVQGAATGPGNKTTIVQVTVVAGPSVSLIAAPAAVTIMQGASGQSTLTATRTNYSGNIVPSITSGQPAGMTVSFNPNPLTATTSTITVAVAGSVAVGQYNLVITGASGVAGNPTTPLQVNVTAPPAGQIVWTFGDPLTVPSWFGFKDGNGPWQQVQPVTVGSLTTFTFSMASTTGAVAFTQSSANAVRDQTRRLSRSLRAPLSVVASMRSPTRSLGAKGPRALRRDDVAKITAEYRATKTELEAFGRIYESTPGALEVIGGISTGFALNDGGTIGCGGFTRDIFATDNSWGMNLYPGTFDCIRLRSPVGSFDPFFGRYYRNVTVPGTLDLTNWTTDPAVTRAPISVSNAPAGSTISISQGVETSLGLTGSWFLQQPSSQSLTRTAFRLSGSLATDNTYFTGSAATFSTSLQEILSRTEYRGSTLSTASLAMPNRVSPFTVTETVGAPGENLFSLIVDALVLDETVVSATFTGEQLTVGAGNAYTIIATKAWTTANGNTLAMQSKSGAGFPASAYLALPRTGSDVARTATNLTGTTKPVGSYLSFSTRVQVP